MADTTQGDGNAPRKDIRFIHPILGTVDPLGYLEVAGPIPAEEMGLASRRRVRLVGTIYDPHTVGNAYARGEASPRFLSRRVAHMPHASVRPTRRTAYQGRTTVRVAPKGQVTRVRYTFHEPQLAGRDVAVVTSVAHSRGLWGTLPTLMLVLVVAVVALVMGWHDPDARRGHYEGKTPAEIERDRDAEVDWLSMEISVAQYMEVEEGGTEVEARIENVEANHCDQRVRMYPSDHPDDVLYESGAIAPGEYLQTVKLAHALPVGNNEITVEFQGYEQGLSLVSNEGALLGHDTFGTSCAAEVTVYCRPADL